MFSRFLQEKKYKIGRAWVALILSFSTVFSGSVYPAAIIWADEDAGPAPETTESATVNNGSSGETASAESTETASEVGEKGSDGDSDGTAVIDSGDAASTVDTESQINTNTVSDASSATSTATSTPDTNSEPSDDETLTIENTNDATASTTAEAESGTGENEINNTSGNAEIASGHAASVANVLNVVNSNFLGSNGLFQFLNLFGDAYGDIALNVGGGASCNFLCAITQLFFANYNNANVTNNVNANAATGDNSANNNGGDANIDTGNAFAAANAINIVNTNVVGSEYLAFILNAFGAWSGDLVLPPSSYFESPTLNCEGCASGNVNITNENSAQIGNNMSASADTGSNEAAGNEGASTINTGDASSATNVMTVANTNILGNNLMLIYVRTMGKWSGHVFSLPQGVMIIGTDDGFIIDGFGGSSALSTAASLNGNTTWNVANTNIATVQNNISASASTGSNTTNGNGGDATINTGNAYAAANAVNIVNTNVLGRNWIFAILNVFGNWNGNVAFGRPNLWVGSSAAGPSPLSPDSEVAYTLTYRNNGNAYASNVVLTSSYGDFMSVTNPNGGVVDTNTRKITWNLGMLRPGASGSVTFTMKGINTAPHGSSHVVNNVILAGHETDANTADNSDTLVLDMYLPHPSPYGGPGSNFSRLEIKKERVSAETVRPGDRVDYKIVVSNKGSATAYDVIVSDELKNAAGEVVHTQNWDLQNVAAREDVTIDYSIELATSTPVGTYINSAIAVWRLTEGGSKDHSGHSYATVKVEAGASTSTGSGNSGSGGSSSSASASSATWTPLNGESSNIVLAAAPITRNENAASDTESTAIYNEDGGGTIVADESEVAIALKQTETESGGAVRAAAETSLEDLAAGARAEEERSPRNLLAGLPFVNWSSWYLFLLPAFMLLYVLIRRRREDAR